MPYKSRMPHALLLPLFAIVLMSAGCGLLPEVNDDEYADKTAEELYFLGRQHRINGDFQKASEAFDRLEASYPFDPYSQQGMLELAYSQYRLEEYNKAISVLDRFMKQNPVHADLAYAHYLRGLNSFNYGRTLLHYVLPYIRHNKDPTYWSSAFESFKWVVTNQPTSRYAADAQQRTIYLRNLLAHYEMHVADFYLRRKAYVAVILRGKFALTRYQGAPNMDRMLWYMEQAYRHLEMHALAEDTRRTLDLNYPNFIDPRTALENEGTSWITNVGNWLSNSADFVAIKVGFDIEELPTDDFTGKYKVVSINTDSKSEYNPVRKPKKIVVSEVPSGFVPDPDAEGGGFWQQLKQVFRFDTADKDLGPAVAPTDTATETPVEEILDAPTDPPEPAPAAQ